jgi:copper transport protein
VALLAVVPAGRRWAASARFSRLALVSVVVLALTGTLNAWRQAGSLSALTGSSYGTWLFWKLGLVALVLAIASRSRRVVRGAEPSPPALRRLVAGEIIGICAVLAVTAGLVSSAPPRRLASAPLSVSQVIASRIAQVVLDPPVAGGATMHVYLSSVTGSLDQPTKITVTADLPAKDIVDLAIPLSDAGPGHLTSPDAVLPVAGAWTIVVTARYSEFDQVIFRLPVRVT